MWTSGLVNLLVLTAALIGPGPAEDSAGTAPATIVVRNEYWAKPGMEEDVYRHRLYASQVRARLRLCEGRVLRRISDSGEQPDVIWECEYPSLEARDADTRALDESGEFEPVMERMGALIEKFDRSVWRLEDPAQPPGSR